MVFRVTITLALAFAPAPLLAQAAVQPIGVSDADALAEQVRRLGANPLDLDALLTAAELSLRLDDLSAAGSFLARAEKIAPSGARGLGIKGAILVRSERPGEALRQFAQAEALGLPPARFAADRALAYDLIGDQPRAQRDYRLALRDGGGGGGDETRRRYALSLGIAGNQREALDELAPLVRRNDRAAWRTRAFVLAMGGDAAEASRIASTMMPPGSAQGLKDFFAELPTLPAIDRAFAVHFGEVRASSARLADARLAPPLAPLPVEPAPVTVAAVVPTPVAPRDKGKRKTEKQKPGRVAITYGPIAAPAVEAPAQPPSYQAPVYQPPLRSSTVLAANTADRPLTPGEQASLAAATLKPSQRRGGTPSMPSGALGPVARADMTATRPSVTTPAVTLAAPTAETPALVTTTTPPPGRQLGNAGAVTATPLAPLVAAMPARVATPTPRPPRAGRGRGDDILAKIVANLSIPAAELGIEKAPPGGRTPRATDKPAPAVKTAAERKAEARKALADKKAADAKKAAAAEEAAARKAARAEPSRIWVQVASGANERDLAKAWDAARGKSPADFTGRRGYTAQLQATNRVLTGPFKTPAEARAYVNRLAKNGVSAFSFTSDAGQKVSRLDAK